MTGSNPEAETRAEKKRGKGFSLSRIFSRVALPRRRLARALMGVMIGGVLMVGSSESQSANMISAAPVVLSAQQLELNNVDALTAEFGRTQLGRDMLGFMRANNITIEFDPALDDAYATYNNRLVRMSVNLGREEQVIYLAHELRHAWQDVFLNYGGREAGTLTPEQRFALRRFIEADARAFSALFEAQRREELGGREPQFGTAGFEQRVAGQLRRELDSKDGLTNEEYVRLALINSFAVLGNYNDKHLAMIEERLQNSRRGIDGVDLVNESHETIRTRLRELRREFFRNPTRESFAAYLREFGGTTLDPRSATALEQANTAVDTLLVAWPMQGVSGDDAARIARLMAEYRSQQAAISRREVLNDSNQRLAELRRPNSNMGPNTVAGRP